MLDDYILTWLPVYLGNTFFLLFKHWVGKRDSGQDVKILI